MTEKKKLLIFVSSKVKLKLEPFGSNFDKKSPRDDHRAKVISAKVINATTVPAIY